ncbi:oxygen-independent coproporphyrinogen III oxidase [Sphingobium nicotianae]|uniref:Coproporphyrinogen-III oxidase n=1 Tax=Sphingobium nicotianae TaxID=2782607 RepID=A0A9X1ITA7_9SPHN|nr:oxygen-independent coproporphyrinogen III oxidase [Sphingobium nicotianae]MBT2189029.1 oxygen-independent coproporphyrinogen III oxidase [Sphingobium nicotianae]
MWFYHPDLLARPVPRYTSYPTAAEFTDAIAAVDQAEALEAVTPGQSVSLYVHIPFCQQICWYCGCNTGRANREQRLASYLDALCEEIRTVSTRLGDRGRIDRIAFGGGSPNALAPEQFTRLLQDLIEGFGAERPILSIELDPRTYTAPWAATLRASGVSRASLGVQTFDPAIQAAIGRVQPREMIADTVDSLRASGVTSINFDLIYGLPDQDRGHLDATLDETLALRPERIALFGYAHVPHLLPRQRRIAADHLPDQAERFAMAELGHHRLTGAGYVPIGFDHFALPHDDIAIARAEGRLHRNFQGFTEDDAQVLIGLGATAISQFPDLIVQNEKNSGRYRMRAGAGQLCAERGIERDSVEQARSHIIEALLCERAATVDAFLDDPGVTERLWPFLHRGLARLIQGRLQVTAEGRPYSRVIASIFDRHRGAATQRFSTAI